MKVIHVNGPSHKGGGDVFFFTDGCMVGYGVPEDLMQELLKVVKKAEINSHTHAEKEDLEYIVDKDAIAPGMRGDLIVLRENGASWDHNSINNSNNHNSSSNHSSHHYNQDINNINTNLNPMTTDIEAKVAFANGFARSTKLAVLEAFLDECLESLRFLPRKLMEGTKLPDQKELLRYTGQLLYIRSQLNLHSELTETPELYWAKPELEEYYRSISKTLDIMPRIAIINRRLDYGNELASKLKDHLDVSHGVKLEVAIIALICVEVGFNVAEWAPYMFPAFFR